MSWQKARASSSEPNDAESRRARDAHSGEEQRVHSVAKIAAFVLLCAAIVVALVLWWSGLPAGHVSRGGPLSRQVV
jgi:hypothetical protein